MNKGAWEVQTTWEGYSKKLEFELMWVTKGKGNYTVKIGDQFTICSNMEDI